MISTVGPLPITPVWRDKSGWSPTRAFDQVETWITSDHMWRRRAAFVITLPYTKQNFPKPHEIQARERVLGWAAELVNDHDWFIQKAIAWWCVICRATILCVRKIS